MLSADGFPEWSSLGGQDLIHHKRQGGAVAIEIARLMTHACLTPCH